MHRLTEAEREGQHRRGAQLPHVVAAQVEIESQFVAKL